MAGLEYDVDDFDQATWPVTVGTLVYLFDRRGKYCGEPCVMMRCWQPKSSGTRDDGETQGHHPWRGCVRFRDGTEMEADATEIMVLRSASDLLDLAKAEMATLPVPVGQPVYVLQRIGSDNCALVRCSILEQRLEKSDAAEMAGADEGSETISPGRAEPFYQGVWWIDIRVEAGSQAGKREQVSHSDLYVPRVDI